MSGKQKLVYISTDPTSGDEVAAYLRTGSHALTSTDIGGKKALDVNVANAINVDTNGVYADPSNLTPDSIGNIFHSRAATPDATNQIFRSTGGAASADSIVAANVHGIDVMGFLMGFNGTTWDRLTSTSSALDINIASTDIAMEVAGDVADDATDAGNPIKVGSRTVDSALTEVSTAGDRADAISDMYRRIFVNNAPDIAVKHSVQTVGDTTRVQLDSTPQSGRTGIFVQNLGNKAIYIGNVTVTKTGSTRGIWVPAGSFLDLPWGEHIPVYAVSSSGDQDVMFFERA